jgi:hypothetical protein
MNRHSLAYLRLRFIGLRVKRYRLQAFAHAVDVTPLVKTAAAERFFHAINSDRRDVVGIEGYGIAAGHTRTSGGECAETYGFTSDGSP